MNKDYKSLFDLINSSSNILILNSKPDGDSIGASLALNKIIKKLSKPVTSLSAYSIPDYLIFLRDKGNILVKENLLNEDLKDFDLVIIVDSDEIHRCLNSNEVEFQPQAKFISIDHHQPNISNTAFTLKISDTKAESTCGQIVDICKSYFDSEGVDLMDEDTAFLLFAGIVSDTDYFGYSNVTQETFERAAFVKRYNFDQIPIIYQFRETLGYKAFQFIQRNLHKVVINAQKRYGYLKVKKEDYAEDDNLAIVNEATNFLNRAIIRILDIVDFSFIIKEIDDERSSMAFRRHNNGNEIDLSKVAKKFGGGGHKQSAGGLAKVHVDKLEREITEYLDKFLK